MELAIRLIEIHGFLPHYDVVYLKLSVKTRGSNITVSLWTEESVSSVPDILIVLWPCKFDAMG